MLDQYGFFAFLFIGVFMLCGIFKAWAFMKKTEMGVIRFVPLMAFLCFFAESLTEQMMLMSPMLLSMLSVPAIDRV